MSLLNVKIHPYCNIWQNILWGGHEHSGDWLWDLMCGMEVPYLWTLSQLHFLKKARLHVVCMYTFYLFTESGLFASRIRNYLVARSKIFSVSQPTNWGTRLLMDRKAWHWDSASWLRGSDPSSSVVFLGFVLCSLPPLSAILDLFLVSILPPRSVLYLSCPNWYPQPHFQSLNTFCFWSLHR